ncbi:MAG: LysR family transcriptional regulator [Actinobacteria bacterium]|nr:LysR family transcriptional regulator [Actinomycetota bacterium]
MQKVDHADLEALRSLVAVVDHGGFRAAARALYVSQAALTRRIAKLEARLGVTLLVRGPGGSRPSPDGAAVLPAARRVLDAADAFAAATRMPDAWTLRLGVTPTVAGLVLARFMATWLPAHPRVRIDSVEDGVIGLRARLADGECEMALIDAPLPDFAEGRFVRTVTVRAFIPTDHELAAVDAPLPVDALHDQPVMVNGGRFLNHTLFEAACRLARCQPLIRYQSSSSETLALLAETGVGISITGDLGDTDRYDVSVRPLASAAGDPLQFDLYLAWDARRTMTPAARAFIDSYVAYLQQIRVFSGVRDPTAAVD